VRNFGEVTRTIRVRASSSGCAAAYGRARKKEPLRDAGPSGIETEVRAQFLIVPESYMTRVT
jgi:hypothetical protein